MIQTGCIALVFAWQLGCSAGGEPDRGEAQASVVVSQVCPVTSNLAIGATPITQSTTTGPVANINDGVQSDTLSAAVIWASAPPPSWVGVDLGKAFQIAQVEVFTVLSFEIEDYDIEVTTDGNNWAPVVSIVGNRETHRVHTLATPVLASQVRINGHRGSDPFSTLLAVTELVVTGCAPPSTRVAGKITRSGGGPLAGVTVEIGGATATTNASGDFLVTGLAVGTYTVHPSKPGLTFGSPQFQIDHDTVTLSTLASNATLNAVGYDRNPIVYVHGFNSSPGAFQPSPSSELAAAGYAPFFATLQTSWSSTPRLEDNVGHVISTIDDAKYTTGQSAVVLVSHSMGGLVSRLYLETSRYRNDVSQFFSFGSPHRGVPGLVGLACGPNVPGVCDMTVPGMALFNATHVKRAGVDYHAIGGDAPMFTSTRQCYRVNFFFFHTTWCITWTWPDTTFRSPAGWWAGLLIAGGDDGLIATCSSIGQPGSGIDRFITREVHTHGLGNRDYFDWNGGPSQESYPLCLKRVLIDHAASCGQRSTSVGGCSIPSLLARPFGARRPAALSPLALAETAPVTGQRAVPQTGRLVAGQQVSRTVVVEGGGTTFSVDVQTGSASLSLVDPTGQVIDPAYIADVSTASPDDPDAMDTTDMPTGVVQYNTENGTTQYVVPNALPGVWTVRISGNSDIPAEGSVFTANVGFDSTFVASLQAGAAFVAPGTNAQFKIQLPPVASATATMSIALSDGNIVALAPVASADGYTATLNVPGTSGYAQLRWAITGTRFDGVAFERGGIEDVQVTSPTLTWNGVTGESTVPRSVDPGLIETLVLQAQIASSYDGEAQISADLATASGATVAHLTMSAMVGQGVNPIALGFAGDDIYAAGLDGPYTLTNIMVVDARASAVLAATANSSYATAAYRIANFATSPGVPTVTTTGPYTVVAGDTVTLEATGVDPVGQPLSFAWDLDNDGVYETSGRSVAYRAPTTPSSISIAVRAVNLGAHAATATTTIDVLPREVNLAPAATASASSSLQGYAASHVNDGDTSTAPDPGVSWANDARFSCTVTDQGPVCAQTSNLPATLDLDLGAMKTITHVTLYTSALLPIQDYDLSIWDGAAWNLVDRVRGNTQTVRNHVFVATAGSMVRITALKGPDAQPYLTRVNELQVSGY
jgi:pimeloyl-ACP methyl ester carboxylesterase